MSDLYLPDTPEGRAVEQIARAISDRSEPGQLPMVRKLARIVFVALVELVGADDAASFFAGLSQDALRMRGQGRGKRRG